MRPPIISKEIVLLLLEHHDGLTSSQIANAVLGNSRSNIRKVQCVRVAIHKLKTFKWVESTKSKGSREHVYKLRDLEIKRDPFPVLYSTNTEKISPHLTFAESTVQ